MEKNAHLKFTNTYLYKRMLNIPRIVLLFLCVSFTVPSLAETTTMQLPQLSLSLNNVTIREVFNIIEKNTEYVFIFSDELLTDLNGKVSIHVNKQTLDKILDKVLQSTGLTYKITNRQVTVSKKSQAVVQKTSLKVTGHVSDEKGEPLIGVNIQEEGTNNVVVTDMNGNFSMYNISGPSSVLKFTYIGFIPLRVVVGKQTNLSVKLESDVKGLEEVVVVGYGSQKRESVIGAITTMQYIYEHLDLSDPKVRKAYDWRLWSTYGYCLRQIIATHQERTYHDLLHTCIHHRRCLALPMLDADISFKRKLIALLTVISPITVAKLSLRQKTQVSC